MSGLRAIDLQMAMPRAQMAGKIQDQLQQRGQVTQDMMLKSSQQEDLRNTGRVTTLDGTVHNRTENNDSNVAFKAEKESQSFQVEEQIPKASVNHPYKGSLFDETR